MRYLSSKAVLIGAPALLLSLAFPVLSQDKEQQVEAKGLVLEEVYVTARRKEERLQDVPISMTVFNQEQLDNANITNAGDLANYVPSLQVNTRFGGDTTTFAIRGFSQELRTTASVGVYFAEVVAPRGANTQNSGDGAGPGDYFDLQNVQVLKGPQGTLFGRNSTGGAILITPQRPTDEYEGYFEASAGNYDMWRTQGVINAPVTERVRLRLAVDHQERAGYLDNISGIGPSHFADVDYTAVRASMVVDVTDSIENYTIVRYTHSENKGYPGSLFDCNSAAILGNFFCDADLASRIAAGNDGFYDVYSFVPDPVSQQELGQIINTTSWEMNDNLTLKNILAYADFETKNRSALFGTNWQFPIGDGKFQPLIFQMIGTNDDYPTTDQQTVVEELQLQGTHFDDRLTWQTGLYYEKSEPDGDYGAQSPAIISCDLSTASSSNPADFLCNNLLSQGTLQSTRGGATYENAAVYAQGTYDISDQWDVTAGIRYTDDKTTGKITDTINFFPTDPAGGYFPPNRQVVQVRTPESQSTEPTWLLGTGYHPTPDILLYAKYARGYRQGSINLGGSEGFDTHDPESVDSYELGAKTSFFGQFPSTFNVAAFYNDLQDQQIQFGYFKTSGVGTTAILNAGGSTIWGVEAEASIQLLDSLILNASYTYLNTEVDELVLPVCPPTTCSPISTINTSTAENEPLPYSPENKFVVSASYLLPVDPALGDMSATATYAYIDEMQAVAEAVSIFATLPDYSLVNLNFDWNGIMGKPFDMSIFASNVFNEKYITSISATYENGVETGQVGVPRMYGVRVRYNWGG
ncbi:MAG: TonB-dependent receptor [Halioglobus sp.]|nr:TonB-dependent receptor [Halioglobus sp.]